MFLKLMFKCMGPRKWHISEHGVAEILGIGYDDETKRSGSVRLAFEMRYTPLLFAHRFLRIIVINLVTFCIKAYDLLHKPAP